MSTVYFNKFNSRRPLRGLSLVAFVLRRFAESSMMFFSFLCPMFYLCLFSIAIGLVSSELQVAVFTTTNSATTGRHALEQILEPLDWTANVTNRATTIRILAAETGTAVSVLQHVRHTMAVRVNVNELLRFPHTNLPKLFETILELAQCSNITRAAVAFDAVRSTLSRFPLLGRTSYCGNEWLQLPWLQEASVSPLNVAWLYLSSGVGCAGTRSGTVMRYELPPWRATLQRFDDQDMELISSTLKGLAAPNGTCGDTMCFSSQPGEIEIFHEVIFDAPHIAKLRCGCREAKTSKDVHDALQAAGGKDRPTILNLWTSCFMLQRQNPGRFSTLSTASCQS